MTNKFVSFLETAGKDIEKIFSKDIVPYLPMAESAVSAFAPSASPMFNATANAVIMAEQNAAAIGQQVGSGPQKLAAVTGLIGGLIAQGLKDAGKSNTAADVTGYINSVVSILNTTPAPPAPMQPGPPSV
jgi:hypothetical protein